MNTKRSSHVYRVNIVLALVLIGAISYFMSSQRHPNVSDKLEKDAVSDTNGEKVNAISPTDVERQIIPPGYDAHRIDVKYLIGTDISNPLSLIPAEFRDDIGNIARLAPASSSEFRWLRFDLKTSADAAIFITQLRALHWVEIAEFAPLPTSPPDIP